MLPINVGPLNGLGSFCMHAAKPLKVFSDMYREGHAPQIEWDLRGIQPRHISMAGLTAFLSTAYRLRRFTHNPQTVKILWNPQVFSFLDDISFFRISKEFDLLKWPEEITSGYSEGETNPDTVLLVYRHKGVPTSAQGVEYRKAWKDEVREKFKEDLLLRCGRLFRVTRARVFPPRLRDHVSIACAELVVNSLLWGRSPAFVGLQRSPKGITVAVSDSGNGFLNSMYKQLSTKQMIRPPADHLEALILASFINAREFGLRRVIESVIEEGGRVVLWSYDAELYWRRELWYWAKAAIEGDSIELANIEELLNTVNKPIHATPTLEDKEKGFCRRWKDGLRGARIAFEIPLTAHNRT